MTTYREQRARLLAMVSPVERMEPFPPHGQAGDLERIFTCVGCGARIAVGPCWEHINPAEFVGAVCGCLTPATLPLPDGLNDGEGDLGRAGTGRQADSDNNERGWERAMEQQGFQEGAH